MASFFRSPGDLADWVRQRGSREEASEIIVNLPGVGTKYAEDVAEISRRIFSNRDADNAARTLFEMLKQAGITEDGVKEAVAGRDARIAAEALEKSGVVSAEESAKMIKQAQIMRQPGEYIMPLRYCPKLPMQSNGHGLISTYNCRHYCLDSLVLDDDPGRVYCLEAMWRRHVMDKFSHEWRDRETGKWVGGYINSRFHVFPDGGTPGNPDAPRDGGNLMGLKPNEKSKQPRKHEWSTERRLDEQRGNKLKSFLSTASAKGFKREAGIHYTDYSPESVLGFLMNDKKPSQALVDAYKTYSDNAKNLMLSWAASNGDKFASPEAQAEWLKLADDGEAQADILFTLRGDGIGIWDGRWDKYFKDEKTLEEIENYLKENLKEYADVGDSGILDVIMFEETEGVEASANRQVLLAAGRENFVKIASESPRKSGDPVFGIFSAAVELRSQGVEDSEAASRIAKTFATDIGKVASIQSQALSKMAAHLSDVYSAEGPSAPKDEMDDAKELGLLDNPQCPQCQGPGVPLGKLGKRMHYRCRNCGADFSQTEESAK